MKVADLVQALGDFADDAEICVYWGNDTGEPLAEGDHTFQIDGVEDVGDGEATIGIVLED